MKESLMLAVPEIGNVRFRRSARARRLSISIKTSGDVLVTVPFNYALAEAETFLLKKRSWVRKHLEKIDELRRKHRMLEVMHDDADTEGRKEMLRNRLRELVREHGFDFRRVSVRNQKTRWGSCSSKNDISLNIKLTRIPQRLRDYVILHELVHTRVRGHGEDFWQELGKYVTSPKKIRAELRGYRLSFL